MGTEDQIIPAAEAAEHDKVGVGGQNNMTPDAGYASAGGETAEGKPSGGAQVAGSDGEKPMEERQQRAASETDAELATAIAEGTAGLDESIQRYRNWLEEHKVESNADREKREKKERRQKLFAAMGDGFSALSNLFFTTQYAPNVERGKSVTAYLTDTLDKAKADRDRLENQYMDYAIKLGDLAHKRAATVREIEAQHEARKIARKKAEMEAQLHPFNMTIKQEQARKEGNLADKAGHERENARVIAENAPEREKAGIGLKKAQTSAANATAFNSYASAGQHNRTGWYGEFLGKKYDNARDYTKAVHRKVREYNSTHKKEEAIPMTYNKGTYNTIDEYRQAETLAAIYEERIAKENSQKEAQKGTGTRQTRGTMPGVQDGKKMPGVK